MFPILCNKFVYAVFALRQGTCDIPIIYRNMICFLCDLMTTLFFSFGHTKYFFVRTVDKQ